MSHDDEDKITNITEFLARLTPDEAKVLRERFGMRLQDDQRLENIGNQFDVTRERIREIERKALAKLAKQRSSSQSTSGSSNKCSFCGETLTQKDKFVEGKTGVFICSECLGLCSKIIDEDVPDKS